MTRRAGQPPFPIEAIATYPAPGMAIPTNFVFSQDGSRLFYLLGSAQDPTQRLYMMETATGAVTALSDPPGGGVREETLSLEEELRRQRARSLAVGLTSITRAEHADRLLLPVRDAVFLLDAPDQPLRQLVPSDAQAPALSPDGNAVAFVRDGEVHVISATGGQARQLTFGAREAGRTHGLAEYIAQEELDRRDGLWWSPDSQWLAFAEVDETHIPLYIIPHLGLATAGPEAREEHHYPFAGGPNARVRLGVVAAAGGEPAWMNLDLGEESYLARVFWWQDGALGAVLVNRPQDALFLVRFDRATGQRATILEERSDLWINLPHDCLALLEEGGFVWLSEWTGFRHLYLYGADGQLIRPLTSGEWPVDEIVGVDQRNRVVYFTSGMGDPRERQLCAVGLDGGDVRRVTTAPGTHDITFDATHQRCVDVWSAINHPPSVILRALPEGAPLHPIPMPPDERLERFHLEPAELVTLPNREGTLLYGALYRPSTSSGARPYPTIIHVYGGPHAQMVTNSWGRMTAALDIQYLRALGFLIFRLDNRGSARRGLAFEGAIRHRMGTVEVDDQVDGVRWLIEQGLADPARVGVMGWSYGGYMSLMCLAKAPDVFKVAVAGAPVTAYDGYDTAYTERYMSTPRANPEGYREGSVLQHAEKIRGKLLLVHGMLDENVHFRHTARLLNALIRARRPYDTLFFPDERHMPRHPADRVYQQERVIGYFVEHLMNREST